MLKLVQIYCFNLKRFSPDDRETKPKENTLANQTTSINQNTKKARSRKRNTLGIHIWRTPLNEPISTPRKAGKRVWANQVDSTKMFDVKSKETAQL